MKTNNKIVQKEDPILRQKAEPVPAELIRSGKIKKVVKAMSAALAAQEDGVALAAPQVGKNLRLFVVTGKILNEANPPPDLVFINPVIKKVSKKKAIMEEGCLSVRWIYGDVARAERVTVEALDENGQKFVRHGSGLLAQIFQHEMDHLEGILFTDKAKHLQELKPDTNRTNGHE